MASTAIPWGAAPSWAVPKEACAEAVEFATLEWVDWFNNRRLLELIGNIPSAEAEARYYAQAEGHAMAARLKPNSLRQTRRGSKASTDGSFSIAQTQGT